MKKHVLRFVWFSIPVIVSYLICLFFGLGHDKAMKISAGLPVFSILVIVGIVFGIIITSGPSNNDVVDFVMIVGSIICFVFFGLSYYQLLSFRMTFLAGFASFLLFNLAFYGFGKDFKKLTGKKTGT